MKESPREYPEYALAKEVLESIVAACGGHRTITIAYHDGGGVCRVKYHLYLSDYFGRDKTTVGLSPVPDEEYRNSIWGGEVIGDDGVGHSSVHGSNPLVERSYAWTHAGETFRAAQIWAVELHEDYMALKKLRTAAG